MKLSSIDISRIANPVATLDSMETVMAIVPSHKFFSKYIGVLTTYTELYDEYLAYCKRNDNIVISRLLFNDVIELTFKVHFNQGKLKLLGVLDNLHYYENKLVSYVSKVAENKAFFNYEFKDKKEKASLFALAINEHLLCYYFLDIKIIK